MESQSQPDGVRPETPVPTVGVFAELSCALTFARALLSNILDLATLEARRAGVALVFMIVGGVVAAVCIVTAWLGLMAACAMAGIALGMPPLAAVLVVAGINLMAGAGVLYWCIDMSRDLLFMATRRQIDGPSSIPSPAQ
jgi:hypothetical protein